MEENLPPFVHVFHFVLQLSLGGVFNEEAVGHHLSNLGRAADGTQHVFLHLSLPVCKSKSYFSNARHCIPGCMCLHRETYLVKTELNYLITIIGVLCDILC